MDLFLRFTLIGLPLCPMSQPLENAMMRVIVVLLMVLSAAALGQAQEREPLSGKKAKDSYSLGYEFGSTLKGQEVDIDEEILFNAVRDALKGKEPRMKSEEIREQLTGLRKQVQIRYNIRRKEQAGKIAKEGTAFLAQNKTKVGVMTLASGLQYKVLAQGSGPKPRALDQVKVRYRGSLLNGTEFDSSSSGETLFDLNDVIPAWNEALKLMTVGSRWELYVPAELGYGERQFGKVPPNSVLIYDLELVSIAQDRGSEVKGAVQ